ncbi:MAG: hypothetical protein II359_04470 [Clostridia bacterium]|nr:hypothetical protein [Clostridia bacterium]
MKKIFVIFCFLTVLFSCTTAFAGSIPEDLLHEDNAKIFFGEVVSFDSNGEESFVEVIPTKKIKGDVVLDGLAKTWPRANAVGDFRVEQGKVYLFTYFDEHNPTDIFEVTSYDTATMELAHVSGDMWERFERYLHEGRYEEAEEERLDRENAGLKTEGEDISLAALLGVPEEAAEEIQIYYYGKVYDIDVDAFYQAIDGIMLTDIEDVSLERKNEEGFVIQNGMYITINGFSGYAFITDDGKVDKYGMHMSSLPVGAYTMKFIDRAKILALFSANDADLPFLETKVAGRIFRYSVLLIGFLGVVIGFMVVKKRKERK